MKKLFALFALIAYAMSEDCEACEAKCAKKKVINRKICLNNCYAICDW